MTQDPQPARTVLPIPDRAHVGLTTYDAKDPDTSFPPIRPLRPPEGAPNVLLIMIDDCGFGASSTFGGPCNTPNLDRLAANGLKFNRFHTTALCSPTRASLLSGRNHHAVGMGGITEIATSAPGYNSLRPDRCAPLAEILKLNGFSTAQFGKCHEVPVWESSPMGPFDHWPTGSGFEKFYGFVGAETNQWYPALYDGNAPIEPPKTPEEGYHLTEDLTDQAITWLHQQKSLMPDKPFFAVLRSRGDPRTAPRAQGVDRQVQGPLRRRLGRDPRGDLRQAEGPRARSHRRGHLGATRGDPGLGRRRRRPQAGPRAPDGDLRRLPRARRPPHRAAARHPR